MSESNDNGNPGGQDENILDDMMQNNVSFDEDVVDKSAKTADDDEKESDIEGNDNSKNDQSAEKDNHSDISEDDSEDSPSSDDDETDAKDEKSKRSSSKSPSKKLEENHSDISEEEDENFGKDKAGAAESNANNEKKEETAKLKKSRERDDSDGSVKDSGDEEGCIERKKPTLASRVSKPTQQRQSSSSPKRKKGKSYDYATKLNYLFRDARFFLVKSSVSENVSLSKVRGVWSTPPANETRFNKAYKESRNVLLVFSVKESGKFCGLARLATESRRDVPRVPWILPPGLSANALGGVFKIDWICKKVRKCFRKFENPLY